METKKQKEKAKHVVIVTSEAADAGVKQYRIRPGVVWTLILLVCIVIGAGLGYIVHENKIWEAANERIDGYKNMVKALEGQIADQKEAVTVMQEERDAEFRAYELEIEELNNKLVVLSDTVNQKVEEVNDLIAQRDALYQPVQLPLTGAASIQEKTEGEPMCLFTAAEGALVVATANGTVAEIVEEPEYGYKVSVEHGNGYVTIYRNKSVPKVKQGEEIMRGVTIFVVGKDNLELGYQIKQDEVYINPMDMMEIEG